uniref:mRNA decay activator protein ZFP36L2 n=1 Tax=Jaculus jaculus TaxID=51337 RepID=UPI001E1B45E9|nr:mRNA decay activator protein ZFP36L2 [Jaculus jaculus]
MSTTLLSAFYDIDFLCKTEKSLANLNLNNMLDKKAVGTPVAAAPSSSFTPGFLRRHSASNLHALAHPAPSPGSCSPKFPGSANVGGGGGGGCSSSSSVGVGGPASYGPLKEPSGAMGTALLNKENKFRDRSFSENGERSQQLLHLQQQQKGGGGGGGSQINSTRYKTELCRPFEESGTCKYGEKCQFAHGFHELRSLTRHPKYKTELCRTFHTIGFCPYGPRCHFIHNADERRPAPPPSSSSSGAAAVAGDLRAFAAGGARDALHLGFAREPRPKLHHSLSFSGFPSGHHHAPPPPGALESSSSPLLLASPTSRTPPPPPPPPPPPSSCSSASSCSSSSTSSCSAASAPSGGAPTCCASTAAAAAAAAAALLYGTGGGGAEDLLPPGAPCTACSAAAASSPGANNAFAFGPELSSLITPLAIQTHSFAAAAAAAAYYRSQQQPPPPPVPAQPPSPPFGFQLPPRRLSESPVFDAPPSPPDSLSDRDSYLSSGSLSGSESPSLDPGRRLPIFSRLSISDD